MIRRLLLAAVLVCLGGGARAACVLPYTLTAGTLAAASQVMANFNALAACFGLFSTANPNTMLAGPPSGVVAAAPTLRKLVSADLPAIPGCVGDGVADDTACLQTFLNSGVKNLHIPAGTYNFTSLTIPNANPGFDLSGEGNATVLVQKGTGIKFLVLATLAYNCLCGIRDISFDGTLGTGNTLDTTYAQTIDIKNLFFNNVPVGFTSLKVDGNPGDGSFEHDVRLFNVRIYSTTAGNAGIALGSFSSDGLIDGFQMNGGYVVNYNLFASAGAQTWTVSNSHPYNALINVVRLAGSNGDFKFVGDTFDSAKADVVRLIGSTNTSFTNVFFEGIQAGQSGLLVDGGNAANLSTVSFSGSAALAAVREINSAFGTKVSQVNIDNLANYTTPFVLPGLGSYVTGLQGYSNYGSVYSLSGVATTDQLQNTTIYYGANGGNAAAGSTGWPISSLGYVIRARVDVSVTPAAGQTYTFTLINVNGNVTLATGTISNGSYVTTLTPGSFAPVAVGDQIYIKSVFSATSGSATPRYSVLLAN